MNKKKYLKLSALFLGILLLFVPLSTSLNIAFAADKLSATAHPDISGNGTVTIKSAGKSENFNTDKLIGFTNEISNGFTVTAMPSKSQGSFISSITAKVGSRIIAESKMQNTLSVPDGALSDGDICDIYIFFDTADVYFSRYANISPKSRMTSGASKSECKKAVFNAVYEYSKPETLTVNDVTMKMERDIVGYVDFDYILSRFGSRDKETVKITYSYNGKSITNIVSIGFGAVNTEIIMPDETIVLNEGDDYENEIKSQLGVRIRNGDSLKNAPIKLSGLDTKRFNITQRIKAIYDGETGVTESCKADVSVKIIPTEYIIADEFSISPQPSGQKVTLNVTSYFDTSTQDVLLAGYDENGILREFKMLPKRIFAYGKNTLSFDIADNNIAYYKLFIWKDILKMKPKYTKIFKLQSAE